MRLNAGYLRDSSGAWLVHGPASRPARSRRRPVTILRRDDSLGADNTLHLSTFCDRLPCSIFLHLIGTLRQPDRVERQPKTLSLSQSRFPLASGHSTFGPLRQPCQLPDVRVNPAKRLIPAGVICTHHHLHCRLSPAASICWSAIAEATQLSAHRQSLSLSRLSILERRLDNPPPCRESGAGSAVARRSGKTLRRMSSSICGRSSTCCRSASSTLCVRSRSRSRSRGRM